MVVRASGEQHRNQRRQRNAGGDPRSESPSGAASEHPKEWDFAAQADRGVLDDALTGSDHLTLRRTHGTVPMSTLRAAQQGI
jgi:hypothetical protein